MSAAPKLHAIEAEPGREVTPVGAAPGLGFSMQVDLGAGRVCTLQTFLPNTCGLGELNAMLDKMTQAGDRQRAHYQIEGLQRELAELEKRQAQNVEDLAQIDETFAAEQKDRAAKIEAAKKQIAGHEAAHAAWAEQKNVRDPSRLKSNEKANIEKLEKTIAGLEAEMSVAGEDELPYATSKRAAQLTVDTGAAQIAKKKAEIERNQAIVAGGLKD